jgi:hypothetical protein
MEKWGVKTWLIWRDWQNRGESEVVVQRLEMNSWTLIRLDFRVRNFEISRSDWFACGNGNCRLWTFSRWLQVWMQWTLCFTLMLSCFAFTWSEEGCSCVAGRSTKEPELLMISIWPTHHAPVYLPTWRESRHPMSGITCARECVILSFLSLDDGGRSSQNWMKKWGEKNIVILERLAE